MQNMNEKNPQNLLALERDRMRGALLGLAVGDAVGTTLEFKRPGSFEPINGLVGGGPFGLQPGQWTDDTSMALCLADSLLACGDLDPVDQMKRYIRWRDEGYRSSTGTCFDIGITVGAALSKFAQTGEPLAGSVDANTAGNGSLMRLAPVPLVYHRDAEKAVAQAALSSKTTHGATAAVDACRHASGLIVMALRGATKQELLARGAAPQGVDWKKQTLCPEIEAIAKGSYQSKQPPEIKGSGYVVASWEAALWAFFNSSTFEEGCLLAANLGDDADTTAAIYGQLAGAHYGESGIPRSWLNQLYLAEEIAQVAESLSALH